MVKIGDQIKPEKHCKYYRKFLNNFVSDYVFPYSGGDFTYIYNVGPYSPNFN